MADRSEERFSRNAETDLVCRLLLEKKKKSNYDSGQYSDRGLAGAGYALLSEQPALQHAPHLHCRHNAVWPCLGCPRQRFFFNDRPPPDTYTLSLHDALPISSRSPLPALAIAPETKLGTASSGLGTLEP